MKPFSSGFPVQWFCIFVGVGLVGPLLNGQEAPTSVVVVPWVERASDLDPPKPERMRINTRAIKGGVLPVQRRNQNLEIADWLLNFRDIAFVERAAAIENPFVFEVEPEPVVAQLANQPAEVQAEPEPEPIASEATVLRQQALMLQQQVRGTIELGSVAYLLVQGNRRLPAGYQFSAGTRGRNDIITLRAIDSRSFTLTLGDEAITTAIPESQPAPQVTP